MGGPTTDHDATSSGASPLAVTVAAGVTDTAVGASARPPRLPGEDARPATIGRHLVIERLGAGAMGVVYAAYDPELDRKLAIKVIAVEPRGREDLATARFRVLREAQAMARVAHPGVVQIFDVGTHDGQIFLAMELVDGETLGAWLARARRPWREILDVFVQAGRGLAAAHRAGLVHRDFKPKSRPPRPERPQLADRLQSPEFGRSGQEAAGSSRLWVPRDASDLGKPRAKPRSTPGGIKARSTMGRTIGQRRETCSTPGGIKARSTPTRRPR